MKLKQMALALSLSVALAACGGGGNSGGGNGGGGGGGSGDPDPVVDSNVVRGIVSDSASGKRLANVTVKAGDKTVTTNAKGEYALDLPAKTNVVLSFSAAGYAPGFEQTMVDGNADALMITLKKQGDLQAYRADTTRTIVQRTESGPYAVIFKPNTLDTDDLNLRVSVTPLDPTKELSVLPGELILDDVALSPLTFAEFTILDSAGNHVNLKPGAEAVVELPIPSSLRGRPEYALGETIHCYSYNPLTGQWEDFVVGTIVRSSVDGVTPVVRATVKHFSWYGAAPEAEECQWFGGRVVSAVDGRPLPNARVEAFPGTVTRSDSNGEFYLVTTKGSNPTIVATRTYTDTTGSVSGMPGAKIIEFGKLDTDFLPLVPLVSCADALKSARTGSVPKAARASAPDDLVIKIGPVGELSYTVQASLNDSAGGDFVLVMLDMLIPGVEGEEASEPVEGAKITLIDANGNAQVVPPLEQNGQFLGMYMLSNLDVVPGTRYTLQIDADNNGTIDGSGSVVAVGELAWTSPTEGAVLSRANFTASWSDSASIVDGYSPTYWVYITAKDAGSEAYAAYLGSDRLFLVKQLMDPTLDLPAGEYNAGVYVFNGWAPVGEADFDVINNVTGSTVHGAFYSMKIARVQSFILE